MLKKGLGFLFLTQTLSTSCFAMEQYVETCLTINGNYSRYKFFAGFDSTDIFDFGKRTSSIPNGTSCRSHVYKFGPKKISMGVGTHNYFQVNIVLDQSCAGFFNTYPGWVTNSNIKIYEKNVRGDFILNAIPVEPGYFKYAFKLYCRISVS